MTSIETLMRDSNPMVDPSTEFSEEEIRAFDLLVRTRSGNVDVQERTKPVEPEKRQRRGWLVAASAFAAVIVVIGAVMLLGNTAEELPPATTPPTTQAVTPTTQAVTPTTQVLTPTTVAALSGQPSVDPEAVAFLEGYFEELNAGDIDAAVSLFDGYSAAGNSVVQRIAEVTHGVAMESIWDLGECQVLGGGITSCAVSRLSEHDPGYPNAVEYSISLRIESGELATFIHGNTDIESTLAENEFAVWMQENHPVEWEQLYQGGVQAAGLHIPRSVNPQERAELKKESVPLSRPPLDA